MTRGRERRRDLGAASDGGVGGMGHRPKADRPAHHSMIDVRVRYAETDQMGVAYHAEYLVWYEVGRTEWLRLRGGRDGADPASYRALEERGYFLPVIEVASRYHSPARYDDLLTVRTSLAEATRVRIAFDYEIRRRADGAHLSTGRSVHAVTDPAGKPRRLPPDLLAWVQGGLE